MSVRLRFIHKLLILTIVPLVIAQIGTLFVVMNNTEREVAANAERSLIIGTEVAKQFLAARDEYLLQSSTVLSSDFALREALAIGDTASAQSALANHAERIEANFSAFISLDGDIATSSSNYPAELIRERANELHETESMQPMSAAIVNGRTYQVYASPLKAPTLLGYLVFGYRIDDDLAKGLKVLTGHEVEIVNVRHDGITLAATSADRGDARVENVLEHLQARRFKPNEIYTVGRSNDESLLVQTPALGKDGRTMVVMHLSWRDAMAPFRAARSELLASGAGLLAVVVGLGVWLSRSISRPIQSLTLAAERMASGDYDSKLSVQSNDEIASLAAGFNRMQSAIADREADILYQSEHNPQTGLPNQISALRSFEAIIDSAAATCVVMSVALLRMDKIASTIGQSLSNDLMRQTAEHLGVHLTTHGVLAHTATNEFIMLIPNVDIAAAENIAQTIHNQLQGGVQMGNAHIILPAKIGIASYPEHGDAPRDIIRRALVARTDAQSTEKAVHVYESGREQHFERQLQISSDLPRAIVDGEISVFFQPKINIETGVILGAEALARWQHRSLGNLRPDEFIAPAEESGTIIRLTRYVVQQAIESIAQWLPQQPQIRIAVNLSARDLMDDSLVERIKQLLDQNGVDGHHLILEVTESSVMENLNRARRVLQQLQQLSIQIAIDDFGTGYSSLAQLKNLPLNELKIDKAFVMDLANSAEDDLIVTTTVELAHGLGLRVVAEGVEDEYSIRRLSELGCDYAQGYFIGKPMNKSDYERWLAEYEPTAWSERRGAHRPFESNAHGQPG